MKGAEDDVAAAAAAAAGGGGMRAASGAAADDIDGTKPSSPSSSKPSDASKPESAAEPGLTCYICLGDEDSVLTLGCACRGGSGGAHVECAISAAVHAEGKSKGMSWSHCPLCGQAYSGPLQMGLAVERMQRVEQMPPSKAKLLASMPANYHLTII